MLEHCTLQMRKTDKSSFANSLDSKNVNKIQQSPCAQQGTSYVLDGGALIHQLRGPLLQHLGMS